MKTRRNRKGGAPSFFGSLFGTPPAPTPVQTIPEATLVTPVQTMPEATMATPVPEGKEMPEAIVSPEAQLLTAPTPSENPSGNPTVDKAVADLYDLKPEFKNYHMRGIINAIGVCNSTEKMQNNAAGIGNSVLNTFGRGNEAKLEMTQCGSQCKARSEKVKAALKELLRIGEGNDALGYIGSGRVAVNSAAYVGNSAASLASKFGSTATYGAKSLASTARSAYNSAFTRKAPQETVATQPEMPQPEQPQPPAQAGGRRRTRRRR